MTKLFARANLPGRKILSPAQIATVSRSPQNAWVSPRERSTEPRKSGWAVRPVTMGRALSRLRSAGNPPNDPTHAEKFGLTMIAGRSVSLYSDPYDPTLRFVPSKQVRRETGNQAPPFSVPSVSPPDPLGLAPHSQFDWEVTCRVTLLSVHPAFATGQSLYQSESWVCWLV